MSRRLFSCLAVVCASAGIAGAAGFNLYEFGGAATGTAGAFIARANDPTAIFYNPAGIAGQQPAISIGTTLIRPSTDFQGDNPYPGTLVTAKLHTKNFFPSHAYVVWPIEKVTVGFGFFTPFGLGTAWDSTWAGRGSSVKTSISSYYFNPVVAYTWRKLSFSVGVQAAYSTVELKRVIRQPILTTWFDAANLDMKATSGTSWGYNAGIRYAPTGMISIGASYRSSMKQQYSGTAEFTNLAPFVQGILPTGKQDVKSEITFPAIMGVGVAVKPIPRLTVEADIVQMNWSVFDSLAITFTDPTWSGLSSTEPEQFKTARSYRIGAEYQITRSLVGRVGYLYDESPEPPQSVSTLLPDANRNSYQVGFGYTFRNVVIDVAYMYLPFNDRSTQGMSWDGFDGLYKTTAQIAGVTVTYRF